MHDEIGHGENSRFITLLIKGENDTPKSPIHHVILNVKGVTNVCIPVKLTMAHFQQVVFKLYTPRSTIGPAHRGHRGKKLIATKDFSGSFSNMAQIFWF